MLLPYMSLYSFNGNRWKITKICLPEAFLSFWFFPSNLVYKVFADIFFVELEAQKISSYVFTRNDFYTTKKNLFSSLWRIIFASSENHFFSLSFSPGCVYRIFISLTCFSSFFFAASDDLISIFVYPNREQHKKSIWLKY